MSLKNFLEVDESVEKVDAGRGELSISGGNNDENDKRFKRWALGIADKSAKAEKGAFFWRGFTLITAFIAFMGFLFTSIVWFNILTIVVILAYLRTHHFDKKLELYKGMMRGSVIAIDYTREKLNGLKDSLIAKVDEEGKKTTAKKKVASKEKAVTPKKKKNV